MAPNPDPKTVANADTSCPVQLAVGVALVREAEPPQGSGEPVVSFRRLGVLKDAGERIARGRPITEGQELHSPVEFGVPSLAAHAGILPRVRRCWEGVDGSQVEKDPSCLSPNRFMPMKAA